MGALRGVTDEPGTVKRSSGGNALGIARCGRQGIGAAHAIAVTSDLPLLYLPLPVDKVQHRRDVLHDRGNSYLGADRPHALALGAALFKHARPENRVAAGAVIEVRQKYIITDGGEPACHVPKFFADARGIHQQKDRREWCLPLRTADEGLHRAIGGRNIQSLLDHWENPSNRLLAPSLFNKQGWLRG